MKLLQEPPVIVTGAAGFLGSHLCERLLERGQSVLALDNLSSGLLHHLQPLLKRPGFTFVRHDICAAPPAAVQRARRIYNLACPASPADYQRMPIATTLSNVLGLWRLMEAAQAPGARLLQSSTSEVYGDPLEHPQRETHWGHVNPIGPRSCYDEGKRCGEALLMAYRRERQAQVRIARIFNSYGPRLRPGDGRVVSNFIVQALRGEPLTVYGDGQQTRSFCYVDDTVRGLLLLMDSDCEPPINLGNPHEHSMLELAELVLRLSGSRSRLVFRPLPCDDPKRRCPDISAAQQALDWRPEITLEDGLLRTIAHFRGVLGLGTRVSA